MGAMGAMGAMWLWAAVGLTVLWGLVAYAACRLLGQGRTAPEPDALRALDERLARGEVTTQEYTAVRQLLTSGH